MAQSLSPRMLLGTSGRSGLSPRSPAEVGSKARRLPAASSRSQPSVLTELEDAPALRRRRENSLLHGEVHTRSPKGPQAVSEAGDAQSLDLLQRMQTAWEKVDARKKIVLACALGFVLSNMDKVNMTVAIIPMGLEMGWSPTTAGLVQSSFFYGFLLMQLPGGILSSRFGGAFVLPRGIALWSAATAAIPFVVGSMPALCVTRSVMGMGEATAPSSIVDMITRVVPPAKRASSVSFAYGGLHVGTLVGLISSPVIISHWGWPSLFYTFGLAGGLWLLWFDRLMRSIATSDPELFAQLQPWTTSQAVNASASASGSKLGLSGAQSQQQQQEQRPIPYRAFLRSSHVQALAFTHFVHNWFHYTMLSWLPTYLVNTLEVDLTSAAQTALLPPVAGIAASACAGALGDALVKQGVPTAGVRKIAQAIGFLAPTAFLAYAAQAPDDSTTTVGCITAALGLCSFSLAGLYCTHGDLSSRYASVLLGLTNIAGSLPGVIGVASVGILFDMTGDWNLALFAPSCLLMLLGTLVYTARVGHDPIDFDAMDNSEFGFESKIKAAWQRTPLPRLAAAAAVPWAALTEGVAAIDAALSDAWAALEPQRAQLREWVAEQRTTTASALARGQSRLRLMHARQEVDPRPARGRSANPSQQPWVTPARQRKH